MSDITATDSRHSVHSGMVVDIAENSLDRATKLLAGIHGGVYKAVGGALARAASSAKSAIKRPITEDYAISQSEFLSRTRDMNHFTREASGEISVVFGFVGSVIPLTKFNTRVDRTGRVTTQVKRSGAATALEHAFRAQMGGHTGIYEREGPERMPVHELYGPATTQMMYSDEHIMDTAEEAMVETFDKRIDHEINRLLNGWGR